MDNLLINMQTPEVLELSKQIKEKLKEADQFGNSFVSICSLNLFQIYFKMCSLCYYLV